MAVITGKNGKVKWSEKDGTPAELSNILNWSLDRQADNQTYVSSSTSGAQDAAPGLRSWNVTIEVLLEDGDFDNSTQSLDTLGVGTVVELELYIDGEGSSGDKYFSGQARVNTIEGEVDIESSSLVSATISLFGQGALAKDEVT